MTNEIKNSPLGFARGTIPKAPSGRHHSNSPSSSLGIHPSASLGIHPSASLGVQSEKPHRGDISIRHYFEINIGTVCMPCGMMISIDHNPDDIFSVENEIV